MHETEQLRGREIEKKKPDQARDRNPLSLINFGAVPRLPTQREPEPRYLELRKGVIRDERVGLISE